MKIDSFRIGLIVIICCILLFLIILGIILLIKWYKKRKKRKYQLNISINNSINQINPPERSPDSANNNIIPKVKKRDYLSKEKKINAYCECFLKPIKYSSIQVYNESCPIDLIPFSPDDKVSVTKCLHSFHYDCIKKYLLEDEDHNALKCPICLTVLLDLNSKS